MSHKHFVIIVVGLGDEGNTLRFATQHFRRRGLTPIVHLIGWRDKEKEFHPKLDRLLHRIDALAKNGNKVSLIGCSAGGSAVLNAFVQRRDVIHRVVNICGRLRVSPTTGFRSFASRTKSSPAFAQSVKLFEKREGDLQAADKKRMMTVRAMFGDELVPSDTATVDGAYNIAIPTTEHVLTIAAALTVFSKPIIKFLI